MKKSLIVVALVCLLASGAIAAHGPKHQPQATGMDVPADAAAAAAVVDAFSLALKTKDFEAIQSALASSVIVLEEGGAERDREEYMGHHAIADALFMAKADVKVLRRTARADGDSAWVASETEISMREGEPNTQLGTETMILDKTADGWKIVHIHWSSRPKQ